MPSQVISSVENNFTKGLITESTGLNFPENAATDCNNSTFTLIGDVLRREGIDYETNFSLNGTTRLNHAVSTYKWNNVGGDGLTQFIVVQNGSVITFYSVTKSTITNPLSNQLVTTIDMTNFTAVGNTYDPTVENQYTDGNGYLFVFNSNCDPVYISFASGVLVANVINIKIRDFTGVVDNLAINTRPKTLSTEHQYNIQNRGWTSGNSWSGSSQSNVVVSSGSKTFTTQSALSINNGDVFSATATYWIVSFVFNRQSFVSSGTATLTGTVTGYSGTTLTTNVTSSSITANSTTTLTTSGGDGVTRSDIGSPVFFVIYFPWSIASINTSVTTTWNTAEGNYPSNSDVWWYFKNISGVFDPATVQPSITLATGSAPQGHYILDAFNSDRSLVSGVSGITPVTTMKRPSTGAWFQSRVWYTGLGDSQAQTGDAGYYTWSENIYFSQVNISASTNFGLCFQNNDPTSENLFDLLPTDGGVIQIQGSGQIYRLFPIQNGMLVFASNGVWFITGSQGIGFAANDYTITKISSVESMSYSSYVDVMGLPYFWNEEGIYAVEPQKGGGLIVNPLTVGTILTFYNAIPKQSKKFARGAYHPIDYTIQWIYRSVNENNVTERYTFDSILNYNTYNKAFFPYSVDVVQASINGINYVQGPGGGTSPDPVFKYLVSPSNLQKTTFAEEGDTNFVDWFSVNGSGVNYISFFTTGYKLHGDAQKRFQIPYLYTYSRNTTPNGYYVQGLWDYGINRNSNRWTSKQKVTNFNPRFGVAFRRHRIRGQGLVLQFKITSIDGSPFDIMGWSVFETVNVGV